MEWAHGPGDAFAGGVGGSYVAAIGDVRTAAFLVWLNEVGTDDSRGVFGDKDIVMFSKPVGKG